MYRWSNCPGSVNLLIDNPMPSSGFAQEGTQAHDLADQILSSYNDGIMKIPSDVDQEMLDYVMVYVDYCENLIKKQEHWVVEQGFELTTIDERAFGTNDFSAWTDFGTLDVVDLKYGAGVEVHAENNKQLMYYALGCVIQNDLDVNTINLHIVQPRIDDPIKVHTITYADLMSFKEELIEAINRVDMEADTFNVGNHCRFCNQAKCPAYQERMQEEGLITVEPTLEIATPEQLEEEKLMKVYNFIPTIQSYIKSVEALVKNKTENGEIDPTKYGKKLVRKLKNRSWVDAIPFEELGITEDECYERKPLTPAKVEKLFKGKDKKDKLAIIEKATERVEGGLSLVDESAKGEPVTIGQVEETLMLN